MVPAAVTAALIRMYAVDVPFWDQWEAAILLEQLHQGTLTLRELFAQDNEYRQFFPNLAFVSLGRLTGWDVRYEIWLGFGVVCLTSVCLYRLDARTPGRGRAARLGCWGLANLLLFSPVQHENWLFGVQLVYFAPGACLVAGLLVSTTHRWRAGTRIGASMALAAVATFSSANGVVTWLVLAPLVCRAGDARRRRLIILAWAAACAACIALYLHGYTRPAAHPSPWLGARHPGGAAVFFLALLGSPFALSARMLPVATVVGGALLCAFGVACYRLLLRGDPVHRAWAGPFLALGAYSVASAALVTAGRLGFGAGAAMTSRYTTFSLYLAVSLVYTAAAAFPPRRGMQRALAAAALVALNLAAAGAAVPYGFVLSRRERLQTRTCLRWMDVAPNRECLAQRVYPDAAVLRARAHAMNRLGYLRPPLARTAAIDGPTRGAACAPGVVDGLAPPGEIRQASGWAGLPHARRPADAVLLTAEPAGLVVALAVPQVGVRERGRWRAALPAGKLPPGTRGVRAWAVDALNDSTHALCSPPPAPRRAGGAGAPARRGGT
jgi:hypothetical protein